MILKSMNDVRTIKNLRIRYILALSIIALLVTSSYLTMQRVISKQRDFSNIINLAGHQLGRINQVAYWDDGLNWGKADGQ